jgi:regulator of protease activity HflC (stomatin/prohibitin superfamily)
MITKFSNPCIRCGKERKLAKKWKEKTVTFSGTTIVVTRTLNVCPDKECQAIVDKELNAQKAKRDKIKKDREDRAAESLAKKADIKKAHLLKTA